MAAWPNGVASLPTPIDTDVLGTGASMGGGVTLADVLQDIIGETVALETYLESSPVTSTASSGSAHTLLDPVTNPVQPVTLTAICTITMPTAPTLWQAFVVPLIQDATGHRTATFTGVKWNAGTAPTLSTAGGAKDILTFVGFGGVWYGGVFGLAFA